MPTPLLPRIRRLVAALLAWPAALRVWWVFRRHRVHGGRHALFRGRSPVITNRGHLTLGDHLDLDGRAGPVRLTVQPGASLAIGHGGFINGRTTIAAARSVRIGDDCLIGEGVSILDTDFHPVHADTPVAVAPVAIGRNVWLANHVTVLRGVTIGDHAVVGAGAVVTHDVPARAIAVGNPARVVGTVRCDDSFRRGSRPPTA